MDKVKNQHNEIPGYLQRNPDLYIRDGDQILPALPEDNTVARGYVDWPDKGPVLEGRRLTIMTKKSSYSINEEIRVIHVFEATEPGKEVYIMGPKPVYGEHVNDKLTTQLPPENEDPFEPLTYNGVVLPSPNAVSYTHLRAHET